MILNYRYENNCSRILLVKKECGSLFIVSGPSGVGKTSVVNAFLQEYQDKYAIERLITYTTKQPRVNELHGIDYHFIGQAEFQEKIEQNFFLEWSGDYGACYGTPAHVIDSLSHGKSYILVIDRHGAQQIVKQYPQTVLLWMQVGSLAIIEERLRGRKSDSAQAIEKRLALAVAEIEQEAQLKLYHHYIDNHDFVAAVDQIARVIIPRCIASQKK